MAEYPRDSEKTFKILSIDGGGIRGVYSAHILKRIEEEFKIKLHEHFDLIAGTSTGSIIAGAIACDIPIDNIFNLYITYGNKIFNKSLFRLPNFLSFLRLWSQYNNKHLKKILEEQFGDKTLSSIDKPLIIPASNLSTGKVYVSKSFYHNDFIRDKNVNISQAILASCSAPLYFNPIELNKQLLCDGGLWANNPSLVAVIDSKFRLNQDIKNIKILSIGTGLYKPEYSFRTRFMGLLSGWKRDKLVDFILSLQAQSIDNYLDLLLERSQKYRINFESTNKLPLDQYKSIKKLIAKADEDFTYNALGLKSFLEVKE